MQEINVCFRVMLLMLWVTSYGLFALACVLMDIDYPVFSLAGTYGLIVCFCR